MQVVIIIVVILVVIGLLQMLFEKLGEGAKYLNAKIKGSFGWGWVITTAILCIGAFLLWELTGLFIVLGICFAAGFISMGIKNTSVRNRATADINRQTQQEMQKNQNDSALVNELNSNCGYLGFMTSDMWAAKLPNYANCQYTTSFSNITTNFAKQMEKQYITNNKNWFEPFIMYIVSHPQGSTTTKMLNETLCPALQITHSTPDLDLLHAALDEGTKRVSDDVPPLFEIVSLSNGEILFKPTKYAQKRYGNLNSSSAPVQSQNEINFDDL